jgi:hypothetical protein
MALLNAMRGLIRPIKFSRMLPVRNHRSFQNDSVFGDALA